MINVNAERLVKVVFARFLHGKITVFSSELINVRWGNILRL